MIRMFMCVRAIFTELNIQSSLYLGFWKYRFTHDVGILFL